ncbi:MAG TPA: nitrogen fixation protein NifX [Polyangia bacterium]
MKVAFTSSDGERINEHFGSSTAFFLWDIEPTQAMCVGKVDWPEESDDGKAGEDRITARATALQGCSIVCTLQIGGPAAAKLVARHIHPMKTQVETPVSEMVGKLQHVLRGDLPPWLAKTLGVAPRRRHIEHMDEE